MDAREREARKLHDALWPSSKWRDGGVSEAGLLRSADYILASRKEREGPLVACIERDCEAFYSSSQPLNLKRAQAALAAHARLDAPPEPTPPFNADVAALVWGDVVEGLEAVLKLARERSGGGKC